MPTDDQLLAQVMRALVSREDRFGHEQWTDPVYGRNHHEVWFGGSIVLDDQHWHALEAAANKTQQKEG